jgi:hypothetical protein
MKTGLWNGTTLRAERVRDPEVQVLLRFLGGAVKASTADPSNPGFTAEIRLCMELRGVGLYPGLAVCTRQYIPVSGLQVGNSPTTCRMTARLERNGERFETAEWIDGEHVS